MDGIKEKLNSLQVRLGLVLAVVMAVAAVYIGVVGYYSTLHDVHELQDDYLRVVAAMVDARHLSAAAGSVAANPGDLEDPDAHVLVELVGATEQNNQTGDLINRLTNKQTDKQTDKQTNKQTDSQQMFPADLDLGLHTIQLGHIEWRVFVLAQQGGAKMVVAQKTEVRNEIARHAGFRTVTRILTIIPFLIVLMIAMLRWMLGPLTKLSMEINARHPENIQALSDRHLPTELRPFIFTLNAMLARIAAALEQQRRFVADAAHELRSPLTALTLQTRNFSQQEMSEQAHHQFNAFARGLKRANDLVDQLLAMARAQQVLPTTKTPVSLQQVVRVVFEEMMPFAEAKKVELGFEQDIDVVVVAGEMDLITLVRNLVDNAIRYSAADAAVDVRIKAEGDGDCKFARIEVRDSGPGISPEERARVFDPFYRVLGTGQTGSGLGLSIVKSIVINLRGEISLDFSNPAVPSGTIVVIKIPVF